MKNIPGLPLFLDFEKAFHTVEWSFIEKTFRHFNFGQSLVNWIKTLDEGSQSCILPNGWCTSFLELSRAARQGCPLFLYLFILNVEVLADKIKKSNEELL